MFKVACIVVLFLILSLHVTVVPASAQDAAVPRFERMGCQFDVPRGVQFDCGFVVVPEFHHQPDGDTIRLSVAVLRGSDDAPQDPVMLLSGGPGEKTIMNAGLMANSAFAQIAGERDLILFDQRGVGISEPALECPEWVNLQFELLEREPDANGALQAQYDAMIACRDRFVRRGTDLSAFNTLENASDVRDIVTALGYEQVNLVGVSYGTLLAQTVMREHPEIIRSVILDSVLPTTRSLLIDMSTTAYDALDRVLAACQADAGCSTAYPNIRQRLFDVIDELNAAPVPLMLTDPTTQETYDTYVSGDTMLTSTTLFLYQTRLLSMVPALIYGASEGDFNIMAQLTGAVDPVYKALSRGMQFSVLCAEDLIGRSLEEVVAAIEALPPHYRGQSDPELMIETFPYGVCTDWGVPTLDPSVKEPVVSDVPALLFGGEYDPVTPFIYAEEVAQSLSNGYAYEVPSTGHSTLVANECVRSIAVDFIANPSIEPDASCLAAIPPLEFSLPPTGEVGGMVEYINDAFSIRGVIPEDWQELTPGVFGETAVGTTWVLQQSMPGTVETAEELLAGQLDVASLEADETLEANGYTWNLYELDAQDWIIDIALADDGVTVFLIVFQSYAVDHDELHVTIFLPVVRALVSTQ